MASRPTTSKGSSEESKKVEEEEEEEEEIADGGISSREHSVGYFDGPTLAVDNSQENSELIHSSEVIEGGSVDVSKGVSEESKKLEEHDSDEAISSREGSPDDVNASSCISDDSELISDVTRSTGAIERGNLAISEGVSDESAPFEDEGISSAERSFGVFDASDGIVDNQQTHSPEPNTHEPPPPPFPEEEEEEPPGATGDSCTFSALGLGSDLPDSHSDHEAEHDTSQSLIGSGGRRCNRSSYVKLVILDEAPETQPSSTDRSAKQSHGSRDTAERRESVEIRSQSVTRFGEALARPSLILIFVVLFLITIATLYGDDDKKM
jgi:hypothetical protein